VLRKAVLLEPEKAQLALMTFACLHSFLRRSPDSAAIYTLPGTFDFEENGRVFEGSLRALSNENTSVFPIRKIALKPPLKAKEIREEVVAYFLSGGRVEWQNDFA
jgi:hypothetical protein